MDPEGLRNSGEGSYADTLQIIGPATSGVLLPAVVTTRNRTDQENRSSATELHLQDKRHARIELLDLYSLERRRDRYFVVYVWKIINGHAPNFSIENMAIQTVRSERRGLTC